MNMDSCIICNKIIPLLKLLAEENRLKILTFLQKKSCCVCELEKFALSQSLISHHLADLRKAGLVVCQKNGKWCHYSLTEKGQKVIKILEDII
ncbi:winged helix-turn-helix transcriptional regulator [Candidatus Beckwithbacteria bacterium]|nr:winged helix-turn-helix transcriptional regulator [Candidatus Beckwithbacteria bacterium]